MTNNKIIIDDGYTTDDIKVCIEDIKSGNFVIDSPTQLEQAVMAAIGYKLVELGRADNYVTKDELARVHDGSLLNTEKMISIFKKTNKFVIPRTAVVHRYLRIIRGGANNE